MRILTEKDAQRNLNESNNRCDRLIEQYSGTEVGNVDHVEKTIRLSDVASKNPHHARLIANAIFMEENHLVNTRGRLVENLTSQGISVTPEQVLKVIMLGMANSCRPLFATEWPLQSTNDAFYWIDRNYADTKRGITAGNFMYYKTSRKYAGEYDEKSTAGTGTNDYNSIDTGYNTLIPGKVKVFLEVDATGARTLVGEDDGDGNIINFGVSTSITEGAGSVINYTTGELDLLFASNVEATHNIIVGFHWDSENTTDFDTNVGKMTLDVRKEVFDPRPMPLSYEFSDMSALTLSTTGLGDVKEVLLSAVADEHSRARDFRAIHLMRAIARQNGSYTFDAEHQKFNYTSAQDRAQDIVYKIEDIGGDIYDDLQKGMPNVLIAGQRALTYLKRHNNFVADTSMPRQGCFLAGTINDMKVFTAPATADTIANTEIIITHKSPQEITDVGLIFGNLTELSAELRRPNFTTEGSIATVEDYISVQPKYFRLLNIENIGNSV